MKQNKTWHFFRRIALLWLSFCYFGTSLAQEQVKVVGVVSLTLRAQPRFLSKETGKVTYGQRVKVVKVMRDWSFVSSGKFKGWVQSSSLGERESILSDLKRSSAESSATYKDEVATAGKGFSAEYENMLKRENKELDFGAVDKMESIEIPVKKLLQFKNTGRLQSEVLR